MKSLNKRSEGDNRDNWYVSHNCLFYCLITQIGFVQLPLRRSLLNQVSRLLDT